MANAKKCDRCGKFYERYDTDVNGFPANSLAVLKEATLDELLDRAKLRFFIDLCPDCMNDFTKWLNEPEDIQSDEF